MSYPPPPGQGPNPYGQQQSYGYPQQQPQGGQAGYGYPQQGQQAYGAYPQQGAGYQAAPQAMPSSVNAVRIIFYIVGGLGIVGALFTFIAAATVGSSLNDASAYSDTDTSGLASISTGLLVVMGIFELIVAALEIWLATQFTKGGNGVRITGIVLGALMTLGGLGGLLAIVGIIPLALGILIIVFLAKQDAQAWFNRPRY